MKTSFEKFTEVFDNLPDWKKIRLCNKLDAGIDVHFMAMLDEVLAPFTPTEVIIMTAKDFDVRQKFFYFTGGKMYSIECLGEFFTEGIVKTVYDKFIEEGSLDEWIEANSPEDVEEDEE